MQTRRWDVAPILVLAATYAVTARLGLALDPVAGFATLVWPPTGISIAALLLFGLRTWPGILLGATIANAVTGAPLLVAIAIGAGNTLEAVSAAWVLRRIPRFSVTLETLGSVVGLLFVALTVPMISTGIGVASLYLGRVISPAQIADTAPAWWIGDAVGALLVTPVILVWGRPPHARCHASWVEAGALALALADISSMIFFGDHVPLFASQFHQSDLLFAVLIWAALRFGQRGAATASLGVSAIAVTATVLGHGPFAQAQLRDALLLLQTFMAIVAATLLLLGATVDERGLALQETMRAREEAARANRAKSDFLMVMSHELRTPLNAIAGYSELLTDNVYGPLNEKQADAVTRIHRSEKQLLSVIDEVLGFVSAERGEVTVRSEDVPVAEVFDAVEPLVRSEARRRHFVVKREMDSPKLVVHADPKSLEQILASLLSNASKYTQDGGVITLGAAREGATVRIWVRDTGIGISEEEMRRVFEPFFQAERGTTRRYSGVGLGLTIARDLARRMQGELTIASRRGSGTTASVVLPAA